MRMSEREREREKEYNYNRSGGREINSRRLEYGMWTGPAARVLNDILCTCMQACMVQRTKEFFPFDASEVS